jgi:hypothetical protein
VLADEKDGGVGQSGDLLGDRAEEEQGEGAAQGQEEQAE